MPTMRRASELNEEFPSHVVSNWAGHSEIIERKHYLQVTEEHYIKATQNLTHNPTQHFTENRGNTREDEAKMNFEKKDGHTSEECKVIPCNHLQQHASLCNKKVADHPIACDFTQLGDTGLGPVTLRV